MMLGFVYHLLQSMTNGYPTLGIDGNLTICNEFNPELTSVPYGALFISIRG